MAEKISAKPGDYVKISLIKYEYKGVFLESPEEEKGLVVLVSILHGLQDGANTHQRE